MPRVAGLNVVAVLAAAVAFYAVGMVVYGFTMSQVWGEEMLKNHGLLAPGQPAPQGEALMAELMKIPGAMDAGMAYSLGFLISLGTVIGIAAVMNWRKPASLGAALVMGFVLWIFFGVTGLAYNVIYGSESTVIFGIDLMHSFVAYHLATLVLFLMDKRRSAARRPEG